jgi:hypothetical protein
VVVTYLAPDTKLDAVSDPVETPVLKVVVPAMVCPPAVVTTVELPLGNVSVLPSVPMKVRELLTVSVLPAVTESPVTALDVHAVHVPVRLVITPDAGVPNNGATSVAPVGSIRLELRERTGVVVPVATSIWLAVPVTLVTVPVPPPLAAAHVPLLQE